MDRERRERLEALQLADFEETLRGLGWRRIRSPLPHRPGRSQWCWTKPTGGAVMLVHLFEFPDSMFPPAFELTIQSRTPVPDMAEQFMVYKMPIARGHELLPKAAARAEAFWEWAINRGVCSE